ncbi:asparagine synthase (glutamine-hydrolyzing) [Sphingomonas sinipercae]|uniref:asparagine synthase (glutamine-hydrolyzing) n=1 Tax=Sphingomonas sinipercae TaxID=2714944 RepID=A0A6G7ZNH1_9SPHN|nr:asparagine synthase (glutamine-hydrolyzing) [Sphingomonas sinipercae]QIL02472.1 asparagine synthase (glutamine-hydrolyzing) [Sphingomonas sinipercae]
MCGIAGLLGAGAREPSIVRRMIAPIAHRGPDDEGVWIDADAGVALGQRRLAIIDLSPAGHQPMEASDGRYVIDFNGEIYNHNDIRAALAAADAVPEGGWRGHSDTETLLQGISIWGLDETIARCVGMFAIALWDRRERTLTLARDRFGEKPLYYGWAGKDFVFGSELKALRAHPAFRGEIDREAVSRFMQRGYIPAPLSIYRGIFKLQPGCVLTIESGHRPVRTLPEIGAGSDGLRLRRYWSYRNVVADGLADPIVNEAEAIEQLDLVLGQAVKDQSLADVPVGAFLSGGVDSSTVVALYQKHSSVPVRTFSMGFEDSAFDESQYAAAVARHLGTVHSERRVTVAEAQDVIPLLPEMYDEPFADSSQIPTYLVSRFARQKVTVALTGDGGDELFAGYNRHFVAPRLWRQVERVPRPLRSLAAASLGGLPAGAWNLAGSLLAGQRQKTFGAKLQKALLLSANARSFDDAYVGLVDEWSGGRSPVIGEVGSAFDDFDCAADAPDAVRAMYCDATGYLPGDVLCKVDRASMAVSLETRVPFLDHRVAAIAARIPLSMKIANGGGKQILRKLLDQYVPRHLIDRPKAGFAVPVGEWIKGPLRGWAEELLDAGQMAGEGWLDPALVQRRWRDHLAGKRDSTAALWSVLMFQAWLREQETAMQAAA